MKELTQIFSELQSSFSSLWQLKERGKAIEVITPYATTSAKFISVFISEQNNEFIVSDGGWIDQQIYDCTLELDNECFSKIHEHYLTSFEIKQTNGLSDIIIYYKKTATEKAISSLVMDMAIFISNMISIAQVDYGEQDKQTNQRFRSRANNYLKSFVDKEYLDTSGYLDENKIIRCDAFVKKPDSRLILLNYITGSNHTHFTNSISRANLMFEMANKSKFSPHISRKISVIDTLSTGYTPLKQSGYIDLLLENSQSTEVKWSDKEKLQELLSLN